MMKKGITLSVKIFIFLLLVASMMTYSPYQESITTIGGDNTNIMGYFGAVISGLIFQYFGILGCFLPFFIILKFKKRILFMTILLLLCLSVVLNEMPDFKDYPHWGGLIGYKLSKVISLVLNSNDFVIVVPYLISSFALLFFIGFFIERKEFKRKITKKNVKNKSIKLYQRKPNLPDIDLLKIACVNEKNYDQSLQKESADALEKVLCDFGVKGEIIKISCGPVVTLYELKPVAGTKTSRVIGLSGDIARSMSAISARIAVIPGKDAIGIELPNQDRETVFLRTLIESEEYKNGKLKLPIALGKGINGEVIISDLAKMPHLLVAGTTGSGKSVAINAMILSLVYALTPEQCKFIMIDPKMLELSVYDDIPHLMAPVVTEPKEAVTALKWVVKEMENRYRLMSNLSVRNVEGYNLKIQNALKSGIILKRTIQTGFDRETGRPEFETIELDMKIMPFIVVIIDEMADLMLVSGKDIEASVQRLAQMARAAGIHIITATQRPSVDVITGVIKANFPTRISFSVTSKIDSRTILGEQGAEQLLGMGDMLFMSSGAHIKRVHGPFVSDEEVQLVTSFLKSMGEPEYKHEITAQEDCIEENKSVGATSGDDSLYEQAVNIVMQDRKASISYIQRKLRIGYNRAATLVERMEDCGVITPPNHSGKREILIDKQ